MKMSFFKKKNMYLCMFMVRAHLLSRVWLFFVTPLDCSPPGSSVYGITKKSDITEWLSMHHTHIQIYIYFWERKLFSFIIEKYFIFFTTAPPGKPYIYIHTYIHIYIHIHTHIKSVLYSPLPKPWNSFGKIVILCDKQHHFVKWHSVNFVWGEGGWTGPPPMRRGRLRLAVAVSGPWLHWRKRDAS